LLYFLFNSVYFDIEKNSSIQLSQNILKILPMELESRFSDKGNVTFGELSEPLTIFWIFLKYDMKPLKSKLASLWTFFTSLLISYASFSLSKLHNNLHNDFLVWP